MATVQGSPAARALDGSSTWSSHYGICSYSRVSPGGCRCGVTFSWPSGSKCDILCAGTASRVIRSWHSASRSKSPSRNRVIGPAHWSRPVRMNPYRTREYSLPSTRHFGFASRGEVGPACRWSASAWTSMSAYPATHLHCGNVFDNAAHRAALTGRSACKNGNRTRTFAPRSGSWPAASPGPGVVPAHRSSARPPEPRRLSVSVVPIRRRLEDARG